MSQGQIAGVAGVKQASVYMWIKNYESMGESAFTQKGHKHYSKMLKIQDKVNYPVTRLDFEV